MNLGTRSIDFDRRQLRVDSKDLCGSLVEISSGGAISLVHTSARQWVLNCIHVVVINSDRKHSYLINQKIISVNMEEYNLAVLCLYYLSHGCFDLSLSAESVQNHVLEGYYAFSDYAFVYWPDHLEHCVAGLDISNSSSVESLAAAIREFLARHISTDEPKISISSSIREAFHIFQTYDFSNKLSKAVEFWKNRMQTKAKQLDVVAVLDLDQVLILIRSIIDELASRKLTTSLPEKLQVFHGINIFKCARYNCEYFHEGFGTIQERDRHHDKHERAYLCTFSGCPRAIFGLEDVKTLEQHIASVHHVSKIDDSKFPVHLEPKSINIKEAVKAGNIAAVERWAQQFDGCIPDDAVGIFISRRKRRELVYTKPLHLACRNDSPKILGLLLGGTAKPDEVIEEVIHCVLRDGKKDLFPWAIKFPVSKPNLNQAYRTITVLMARGEDHTALQLLKKLNTTPDNLKPRGSKPYVTAAAESGCLTCLQYLIIHCGMDINIVDNRHRTALIAAVGVGRTDVIKFLVRTSPPDIHFTNKKGESALSKAAANGHDHIIRILFPEPVPDHVVPWIKTAKLRNVARDGNLEEASRILDDVSIHADTEDNDHYTPLLHAVENGHEPIVNALLSRCGSSIDVNHKCDCHHADISTLRGATALILAAIHGYTSIARRLLECQDIKTEEYVYMNRTKMRRMSALQLAEYNKDLEIVRLIQEHNARK